MRVSVRVGVRVSVRVSVRVGVRVRVRVRAVHVHVRLGQRVVDLEGVVVTVEGGDGALEGEGAEVRLAWRAVDADDDAVFRHGGDVVELAHDEGEEVSRHARRLHEGDLGG